MHNNRRPLFGRVRARLSHCLPARGWSLLAFLCAAALLVSFGRTVQSVVTQGHERRAQDTQNAKTLWRCNAIAGRQARDECRRIER